MKPVMQTKFGYPDGNCLAACIASIFECDIDSIPLFDPDNSVKQSKQLEKYLVERFGVQPIELSPKVLFHKPRGYHIAGGWSPRGNFRHAVVYEAGKPVHDPHPDGTFLDGLLTYMLFIRVIE